MACPLQSAGTCSLGPHGRTPHPLCSVLRRTPLDSALSPSAVPAACCTLPWGSRVPVPLEPDAPFPAHQDVQGHGRAQDVFRPGVAGRRRKFRRGVGKLPVVPRASGHLGRAAAASAARSSSSSGGGGGGMVGGGSVAAQ